MRSLLSFALVVYISAFSSAALAEEHHLSACLNHASSDVQMNNCIGAAITRVDAKLNQVYQEDLQELPQTYRHQLIQSERSWLACMSQSEKVVGWQEAGGTMQSQSQSLYHLKAEQERLKYLESLAPIH